jgi:hypothetical protein
MALLSSWIVDLSTDDVLRGQGADPAVIRSRRPALVSLAERALEAGRGLLQPRVVSSRLQVTGRRHERLTLDGGALQGPLIAQHLAAAAHVTVMVCTVGDRIEAEVARTMDGDPSYALAMDGVGSAAVEALAAAACRQVEAEAVASGLRVSLPLSPGMIGWPVPEGQAQIFALVDAGEAGVYLTEGGMMVPRKSLSLVVGEGAGLEAAGSACAFCSLQATCRYQDHYPPDPPRGG